MSALSQSEELAALIAPAVLDGTYSVVDPRTIAWIQQRTRSKLALWREDWPGDGPKTLRYVAKQAILGSLISLRDAVYRKIKDKFEPDRWREFTHAARLVQRITSRQTEAQVWRLVLPALKEELRRSRKVAQ